ncbi:M15 family metallopeptidase [Gracilibacillus massiliensis]|uniref:M15 family metallopeptidase n=1 Tax=Gracilibacillus massiliensis TaxID=1564956 RepID=UPI00071C3C5A|nr:M15 family metallopeptidase [Gracilibacillus massiliensis]
MFNKKIPGEVHPDFKKKEIMIKESGEKLMNVKDYKSQRIIEEPMYSHLNITGALSHCYLRESVLDLLEKAAQKLPSGYQFVIWDGFRPYHVQKAIYDQFFEQIKRENPHASKKEWSEKTENFVSWPSIDKNAPAPHTTGGAVDLTIINEFGEYLDFGTEFDDFSEMANTAYFEKKATIQKLTLREQNILENRRLLYHSLIEVGFSNYHQEWWHFDYGNPWWAQNKEQSTAIYGVADLEGEA